MKKTENIFELIPDHLDDEFIESLLLKKNLKIERIISKGHTSPASGWYEQKDNEWVLLITGAAVLNFEETGDIRLKAGDHINIPAFTRHRVTWTDPKLETVWLAIHYAV